MTCLFPSNFNCCKVLYSNTVVRHLTLCDYIDQSLNKKKKKNYNQNYLFS